tara:strand:+ start:670 stop:1416 length:747 start_codon:yes stop_codon:yes gene_type:complete
MAQISSITRVGKTEPFELQVARGQISWHDKVHKFGFNPLINDAEETIWDVGGIYSYPSTAVKMTATSTDGANDEDVQVTIQGLDADYNEISETVTLNASGTEETNSFFLRVFRAFIEGSQEPSGTINITNTGTTYARVTLGDNQTLMCVWTVPAGYTAYLLQKDVTCLTEANNKFGTIRLVSKEFGGVFKTKDKFAVQNDHTEIAYSIPLSIPEKTDIEVRAIGSSSNSELHVSASLDIIYIKNDGAT